MLHVNHSRTKRNLDLHFRRWAMGAVVIISWLLNSCQDGVYSIMPATVINGIFSGVSMKWYTPAANNTASTGVCLVPNTTNGTVTYNSVAFSPTVALTEAFTGTGVPPGQTFPSSVIFPPTKVALTTNFTQERIVSSFTGTVRVTGIAMQTGTDFFITG